MSDKSETPRVHVLTRAHYISSCADAAGMGTEVPCEEAYGEVVNLAKQLERSVSQLKRGLEALTETLEFVRKETIEECAKVCDDLAEYHSDRATDASQRLVHHEVAEQGARCGTAENCAERIRALTREEPRNGKDDGH